MNESILISVIVPIYGVEDCIQRCVESLFKQTLKSGIEYIFVDDCSNDKSIEILKSTLEKYPHRKACAKIITHTENKGLPQARSTGFSHSSGKYIIHCDSDDWMEENACELLIEFASKTNADIIIYDYFENTGVTKSAIHALNLQDYDRQKIISGMFKLEIPNCVWNKMAKRELYEYPEFIFPKSNMGEDLVITYQLLSKADSIVHLSVPLYNYYINDNSMSRSITNESVMKRFWGLRENTDKLIELTKNEGFGKYFKSEILFRKLIVKIALNPLTGKKIFCNLWKDTYPEINFDILKESIPITYKIIVILMLLKIYPLYMKIKYKELYK